jgi:diphthine synthase
MLYLIGLGLDDKEVTQKGIEALESAEKAFAEFYTNTETVDIQELQGKTGTEIEKLSREEVEQKDKIIESAKSQETAFLVSGDPLTATTHYDIKHRAEKNGIETKVVHAPSIFTSIAETGLNVYKFGRTVTLPKDMAPESIGDHIQKNDSIGLHSLVLLDIDYNASDAAGKLIEIDQDLSDREVAVLERANDDSQEISVMTMRELSDTELGEPPHCIIVIGETSHKEEEFLEGNR